MSKLNILLVGDLNPELDNFLRRADLETGFIGEICKGRGSAEDLIKQLKVNSINTVILDPLTNDPFHPVDKEAISLISELRRTLPGQVAFVLYTNVDRAVSLVKQHSGLDITHFIEVDPALQRTPDYFDHLRRGLEQSLAYLYPERPKSSSRLRISVASFLVLLYLLAIYFTLDWEPLQSHNNQPGLYLCSAIIVISVCLALLKREWQASALTAGALGALLVIAQII